MSSSSKHGAPPINIRGKNSQEIQYYDMIASKELMSPELKLADFTRNRNATHREGERREAAV